ncbi:hypothetical protein S40293_03623 [Stachybotrys chartarum IBT 40293]|nr:hypothetical protein S40293_03623 [Stachybotrys chartarum IBT 40293]
MDEQPEVAEGLGTVSERRARGRPRKPAADDAMNAKREKNRKAQQEFRRRQQFSEREQKHSLDNLEATISHIVTVFLDFADQALSSPWAQQDIALMNKLSHSISTILSAVETPAAHEAPQDDLQQSVHGFAESDTPRSDEQNPFAAPLNIKAAEISAMPAHAAHAGEDYTVSNHDKLSTLAITAPQPASPGLSAQGYANQLALDPKLRTNIFGNGWMGQTATYDIFVNPSLSKTTRLDNPLSIQIAYMSIRNGYSALLDAVDVSGAKFMRAFGVCLGQFSREELLHNLRWCLGPGRSEMDRVATLSPDYCINHVANAMTRRQIEALGIDLGDLVGDLCNADELAKLIRERTRDTDQDIFEMLVPGHSLGSEASSWHSPSPAPHRSAQVVSMKESQSQLTKIIRVSKAVLLDIISRSATCLGNGPLFRKSELDGFILAAQVAV